MRLLLDECTLPPGEVATLSLTTAEVAFKASGIAFLDPKPRNDQIQIEDVSVGFPRKTCTCEGAWPVVFQHAAGCPEEGNRSELKFTVRVKSLASESILLRGFFYDEQDPEAILRRVRDREVEAARANYEAAGLPPPPPMILDVAASRPCKKCVDGKVDGRECRDCLGQGWQYCVNVDGTMFVASGAKPKISRNHLVLVGGVGQRRAYLNVSREEAIRRYRAEDAERLFSAADVVEFNFEDEFWVYDAGPKERA